MTHSKRILIPFSVLLAVVLLAVACGTDSSDDSETVTADDAPVSPGPDTAEPPVGAGPYPLAEITIDYTDGTTSYSYGITCLGDTATLVGDAPATLVDREACLALADEAVQQRLVDGPPADQICTAEFGGPDEAIITGTIDESRVDTTIDLTNGCNIADWNELLADLLPVPSGS